jgi:hypothetical protein
MIGRPCALSTSAALAFIAMFNVPCTAPKTNSATPSVTSPPASAGGMSSAPSSRAAGTSTRELPKRSVRRPIRAIPVMQPAAKASSAMLSRPSLRPSVALTAGIRAVHTPRAAPNIRKIREVAIRPRRAGSMPGTLDGPSDKIRAWRSYER